MERSIRRAFAVGLEHWAKAEQLAQQEQLVHKVLQAMQVRMA